jgi:hypothetical protein
MNEQQRGFQEYIDFLRENFINLVEYREIATGTVEPKLLQAKQDLFDDDPFIVFGASLVATIAFADKNLYH